MLGLLGGAAKGSFARLDLDPETFEAYYQPLKTMIATYGLDGLDLDVEEAMTLEGVIRLIDRLKADFGPQFLVTLAPVAAALMTPDPRANLSGFDYEALEVMRGSSVAWYNTQFYCGWGDISNTKHYEAIIRRGFPVNKVVVGLVTNPGNGGGFVPFEIVQEVFATLRERFAGFGGVMGWEYFNSLPGNGEPWRWAEFMGRACGVEKKVAISQLPAKEAGQESVVDGDEETSEVPAAFEYFSDTLEE